MDDEEGAAFEDFANALPSAFPGVQGSERTWKSYARSFLKWFEYGRLITFHRNIIQLGVPQKHVLDLLDAKSICDLSYSFSTPKKFPESPPRPALEVAKYLEGRIPIPELTRTTKLKAFNDLRALGVARYQRRTGDLVIDIPDLFKDNGEVNADVLRALIEKMPGASQALEALENDPTTSRDEIGTILENGYGKEWSGGTKRNAGTYFRAWAANVGVEVLRSRKQGKKQGKGKKQGPVQLLGF